MAKYAVRPYRGHSTFRPLNVVDERRKPQPCAHDREVAQCRQTPYCTMASSLVVGAQADEDRSPIKRKKHQLDAAHPKTVTIISRWQSRSQTGPVPRGFPVRRLNRADASLVKGRGI